MIRYAECLQAIKMPPRYHAVRNPVQVMTSAATQTSKPNQLVHFLPVQAGPNNNRNTADVVYFFSFASSALNAFGPPAM